MGKLKIETIEQCFWKYVGYKLGCAVEGVDDGLDFPEYAQENGFDIKEAEEYFDES